MPTVSADRPIIVRIGQRYYLPDCYLKLIRNGRLHFRHVFQTRGERKSIENLRLTKWSLQAWEVKKM